MFEVYILYSSSLQRHYVGQTQNLEERIKRHNAGLVRSTRIGGPWVHLHSEQVSTRSEAMILEKKIKKRGAKRFLKDIGM